ncbi:MAG: tRNA 4-thiouridine(8) synthase ThiI [Gammaproteobacteria bacterium]|nr:tRNA 4-thiouridine(8) synthase ThiI [Gammaproteobacteria bacterium]MBT8151343.1 tRNA 4-thiouridine(8) synthase ThiI [Gammaproteobacteria bacterium]NND39997.1 tRNA 4-thiouridine(8) synthase ThiI [Pseudomonadales bacterium]NNM12243.1 tRNA 4-thiouridine(8) synthase ThiI [Pseudomonadales bacterium]RZV59177.1 MAG: tRNA 4-thiouridine(8) synthase ThiI [Pseudomonadales bacterium]
MKYVVKLSAEITIKTRPVRKQFVTRLKGNLRRLNRYHGLACDVIARWDMLEVVVDPVMHESPQDFALRVAAVGALLGDTPGIAHFLEVVEHKLPDDADCNAAPALECIARAASDIYLPRLGGNSFAVRCKRVGKHAFKSQDVERYVGGCLEEEAEDVCVALKNPDVLVGIEIKKQRLFVVKQRHSGLGGLPLGCVGQVLSLVSGGYDSSVASFDVMRRGMETHFCFFNLGGLAHEVGVKQVSHYLWDRYGASHRTAFISVPFAEVVEEILREIARPYMGVVLKRMMLRAANQVADAMSLPALVTGESVAQVSSQTVHNLALIDKVSERLVMRPLVASDKPQIIATAVKAGVATYAEHMPEYCAVISDKPTTAAKPHLLEIQESKFNFDVLQRAVAARKLCAIDEVYASNEILDAVERQAVPEPGQVIIDLRDEESCAKKPLQLIGNSTLNIPFYKLNRVFAELDANQQYLLYCDRGVMSRLHAAHLRTEGHANVKVYQPA